MYRLNFEGFDEFDPLWRRERQLDAAAVDTVTANGSATPTSAADVPASAASAATGGGSVTVADPNATGAGLPSRPFRFDLTVVADRVLAFLSNHWFAAALLLGLVWLNKREGK